MRKYRFALAGLVLLGAAAAVFLFLRTERTDSRIDAPEGFVGSASCRGCHESFYELWAPSHHGLAMQPYTSEFAQTELTPQSEDISVGDFHYRAEIAPGEGWVSERDPAGETDQLRIEHAMGGKNVYYFLTPLDRGRLQVLPVAYDVETKQWFDTQGSAVRHFGDETDEPLHWTERPYTFNTSCYGCHVSQLTKNYDLESDSYDTVWAEPGINCETCHGPAGEHVSVCEESDWLCALDVRIIKTGDFGAEETNTMCAPCHAKAIPLSVDFRPGDTFFDHYDLVTLEHSDFYPDGRDLGENYTYTSWLASPCVQASEMDCLHCHTSSGRFRFAGENANYACMPCHEERVNDPTTHTRHLPDSLGNQCISCHMPMTQFAQMRRSDHSMRPPTPAATIQFNSPNACNLCHPDRDAEWADTLVRSWRSRDYQAPVLRRAELIDAARNEEWARLPEMLADLESDGSDKIYTNSLLRLLWLSREDSVWPAILKSMENSSPLVRGSAAQALSNWLTPEAISALVNATQDEYRLVRIRAAAALASVPREMLNPEDLADLERAEEEFLTAMITRPDDATSHANLGNYYMQRRDLDQSIRSFEHSIRLQPDSIVARVNASLAYNMAGRDGEAEQSLRAALEQDSKNAAANFNLGLLLGGLGRKGEAKEALRMALETEPDMAVAAYNLCILEAEDDLDQALEWCRKATESGEREPRYAFALAFHLQRAGRLGEAIPVLRRLATESPDYLDGLMLLAQMLEAQGDGSAAAEVYQQVLRSESLSAADRQLVQARLQAVR